MITSRRRVEILALVLCLAGGALVARDAWIGSKALLARGLIERAFRAHLEDGGVVRPWSWADTHPIARLVAPRLGVSRIVLSGADGPALAFGPGHVVGSAAPNASGRCVLAGHRDTSFAFLGELVVGDPLVLVTHDARSSYRVREIRVVDERETSVIEPSSSTLLTLVTCHPVDEMTPTTRRLVVVAEPDTFLLDVTPAALRLLYGDDMRPPARNRGGMDLEKLTEMMDDKEVGDPALPEEIDAAVDGFRDDLDEMEDETALYLVGIASLFRDGVGAYELLRRSLPILDKPGKLKTLYEQQLKVWKSRKDKSQHDLEYLQIVLGVKDRRLSGDQERSKSEDDADDAPSDEAVAALLRDILGGSGSGDD